MTYRRVKTLTATGISLALAPLFASLAIAAPVVPSPQIRAALAGLVFVLLLAARDRLLGGEGADCVFTSPPYAVGIDYGPTYEDTISNLRPLLATSAPTVRAAMPVPFAPTKWTLKPSMVSGKVLSDMGA